MQIGGGGKGWFCVFLAEKNSECGDLLEWKGHFRIGVGVGVWGRSHQQPINAVCKEYASPSQFYVKVFTRKVVNFANNVWILREYCVNRVWIVRESCVFWCEPKAVSEVRINWLGGRKVVSEVRINWLGGRKVVTVVVLIKTKPSSMKTCGLWLTFWDIETIETMLW